MEHTAAATAGFMLLCSMPLPSQNKTEYKDELHKVKFKSSQLDPPVPGSNLGPEGASPQGGMGDCSVNTELIKWISNFFITLFL